MKKTTILSIAFASIALLQVGCSPSGADTAKSEPTTQTVSTETKTSVSPEHKQLILEALEVAKQGKSPNGKELKPVDNLTIDDINQLWGKPDELDDTLATYNEKQLSFYHTGKKIDTIIINDKRYHSITDDEVEKVLGQSDDLLTGDGFGLLYNIGNYEVTFNFNCDSECMSKPNSISNMKNIHISPKQSK
jgi:hypothetical protein